MTVKRVRLMIRWVHIVGALVLMCYIYSPFHQYLWFQWLIKLGVIPVLTVTGVWVWKFAGFNKFLGIK